jgi:hypothetical protein
LTQNNYEIGYAKPPQETQFKKGVSGNSRGRPRGSKNLLSILNTLANEDIKITKPNGTTIKMPKKAVALLKALNAACSGDTKSLGLLLPHLLAADAKAEETEIKKKGLQKSDADNIAEFLQRNNGESNV